MEINSTDPALFKKQWEQSAVTNPLSTELIRSMVSQAYPTHQNFTYEILSGGCANLNVKINFIDHKNVILRVFLRDPEAAFREQKLAELIKATIPLPTTYYIGHQEGFTFAFTEYIEGITLRDCLLSQKCSDPKQLLQDAGRYLGKIRQYTWDKAGFFNQHLDVMNETIALSSFFHQCLHHPIVLEQINPQMRQKIAEYFQQYASLLSFHEERNLVHGDFNPANILVSFINGTWKITGIIDWEFAFVSSTLWDVANMLRYAHRIPPYFETAFINGLEQEGFELPDHWHDAITLLNIISLLDCLTRTDPKKQPKRCADILSLIRETLLT